MLYEKLILCNLLNHTELAELKQCNSSTRFTRPFCLCCSIILLSVDNSDIKASPWQEIRSLTENSAKLMESAWLIPATPTVLWLTVFNSLAHTHSNWNTLLTSIHPATQPTPLLWAFQRFFINSRPAVSHCLDSPLFNYGQCQGSAGRIIVIPFTYFKLTYPVRWWQTFN